ncbi:Zn(2)-C6 fungal-type domain-containing protein [Trichoderma simmonsii]|uniref:Zn(2)-C6 fungal-type domain-containing protein n=1 Tax=Trichoderma simmonsii TaxID=1491479 RepID=A0A8G0LA69_9HYPO|nr:Zn(2)-C6 fungal-type domain-containing protein [Trichoderma simmonsii]
MDHIDSTVGPHPKKGRSKNGCYTCRIKKVKCDEARPRCKRCIRLRRLCDYGDYEPKIKHNDLLAISRGYMLAVENSKALPTWAQRAALTRALALPTQLPEFPSSASSLNLTSADHEAIRYFRTTFARIHHTKNPDYSLFSIIFILAQDEPMVMHALLAIGGHEIEFRRNSTSDGEADYNSQLVQRDRNKWTPVQHYSAALGLLADVIGSADDGRQLELDPICAVLYLMLVYEQKYGDGTCSGLSNHLAGAALIVKHRCSSLSDQISTRGWQGTPVLSRMQPRDDPQQQPGLSLFVIRLLVWISLCDSTAATFGLGGQCNSELKNIMAPDDSSSIAGFDALHRYSNSLYRSMWGDAYPQVELLDDVENRDIFAFLCASMQLRGIVAQLSNLDVNELRQRLPAVESAFRQIDLLYGELLEVASDISLSTDNSHRLVANIRAFVPIYHAVKLELLRITRRNGLTTKMKIVPEAHITAIIDLAVQADKHQGVEGTIRVAWPLFVVALETSNVVHQRWVLSRFKAMSSYSKNLERAHRFLTEALRRQCENIEVYKDFRLENGEVFVI